MEQLVGNVTADAKINETKSGQLVVNFSIAIDKSYYSKENGKVENTLFVQCSVWNRPKLAEYITKGIALVLDGDIGADAYLNKQQQPVGVVTMNVRFLRFLNSPGKVHAEAALPEAVADDLPF